MHKVNWYAFGGKIFKRCENILIKSGFIIIGRPNVGKSTLLNQFVGHKIAIVSDKPQTTRNRILGILTTEDAQAVFIDTPGIHKPRHKLGAYMTRLAQKTLEEVDLVLYVVDASVPPGGGEEYILDQLQDPGNLGTIIRTAAAAGVDLICCTKGCADPYSPKVLRSTAGLIFQVRVM